MKNGGLMWFKRSKMGGSTNEYWKWWMKNGNTEDECKAWLKELRMGQVVGVPFS
jgi:hypothetical protein